MENHKPPQSPMSVETEHTAPESKDSKSNAVSNDVIATRHLRIVLESIAGDKNLSEEDRKRKISNFGVLLAHSSAKTLPLNDKKPVTQTTSTVASVAPAASSPQSLAQSKDSKKIELIRAAVLANEEKRKKRSASVKASPVYESKEPAVKASPVYESKEPEATPTVSAPVSLPQAQPKPEKKMMPANVSKPEMKMQKATLASSNNSPPPRREKFQPETKKMTTASASVIPLGSISTQPKKKGWLRRKLKGKKNTDERRGDVDEREYPGRFSEMNVSEVRTEARFESPVHIFERPVHDKSLRSESPVCDKGGLYEDTYVPVTEKEEEGGLYEDTHFPVTEKDEKDVPAADDAYIMGAPSDTSENTIGTFERDYINALVRDQTLEESNYVRALSEGTFEQDAKALNAPSEGTFEQDARAMGTGPDASSTFVPRQVTQRAVGEMPLLSETTFEQDAATRDGDYGNDEEVRKQGSELSGSCGSELSETTFERDMRRQAAAQANQSVHAQISATPSLESVTTFEKEARGRMAVAARSRSFPNVGSYAETNSDDAASECSFNDHFRQDVKGRPPQPKDSMEWETTTAPYPMPKITELQMQLSPDSKSKKSLATKFLTKFSCHCGA